MEVVMLKQTLFLLLAVSILGAAVLIGCEETQIVNPNDKEAIIPENAKSLHVENHLEHGVMTASTDVFGQGHDGPVIAENGATLKRTPNGISMKLTMPAPEPGEYQYPTSGVAFSGPGHPEVFTLWGFIFNDPSAEDWDGAFAVAGHATGGPHLTLSGHISLNTEPFLGEKLTNPKEAKVHLAVAPHGGLDPNLMPEALQTPTGPGPDIWWIALFEDEN